MNTFQPIDSESQAKLDRFNLVRPGAFGAEGEPLPEVRCQPMVNIVIPTTSSRRDLLSRCLDAIEQNTQDVDYEITVLHNGSKSRGWVWASDRAFCQLRSDYLVLMNDDVVVCPGWLPPLIQNLRADPDVWMITPVDPSGNNWPTNPWCACFPRVAVEAFRGMHGRTTKVHWITDCELFGDIIPSFGKKAGSTPDSMARHLRAPVPTGFEREAVRRFFAIDYGREPTDNWP